MTKKQHFRFQLIIVISIMLSLFLLLSAVPIQASAATSRYKITKQAVMISGDCVYTGEPLEPKVYVYSYYGMPLEQNIDFTVTYKNNTEVGEACAVVKGIGDNVGTVKVNFAILPPSANFRFSEPEANAVTINWKPLAEQVNGYLLTYGKEGQSKKKQTTVRIEDPSQSSYRIQKLKEETSYDVSIKTYKIAEGKEYLSEEVFESVATEEKETEPEEPLFPSWEVMKEADVRLGDSVDLNAILNPDAYGLSDYEWIMGEGMYFALEDDRAWFYEPGTAIVYLKSYEPEFVGRVVLHVHRKSIRDAVVTGLPDVVYDGRRHTPEPVVMIDGEVLNAWNYNCLYEDNTDAGMATVFIQGRGDYEGVISALFQIKPAKTHLMIQKKKRTVINSPYRKTAQSFYLGPSTTEGVKAKASLESVSPAKGEKYIQISSSGRVTVSEKTKAGTYTLNVLVRSGNVKNYEATKKTVTFKLTVKQRNKAAYPSFAQTGITGIDAATEQRANQVLDDMMTSLYDAGIDFFNLSALKKAKYAALYIDLRYPYKSAFVNGVLDESRLGTSVSLVLQKGYGDCWGFSDTKRCLLRKVGINSTWCSIAGRLDVGNTNHMRCIVKIGKKYYELNEIHEANLYRWYQNIHNYGWYFYPISKARALYLIGAGPYKEGIEQER